MKKISLVAIVSLALFFNGCAKNDIGILQDTQQANTQMQTQQTQQTQQPLQAMIISPDISKPIKSPVTIHGKVSGLYFFEGTFPVVLMDSKGKELANTVAHADGDWMTSDQVAFTVQLKFKVPAKTVASLVFKKDNPSGLPENDFTQSFAVNLE